MGISIFDEEETIHYMKKIGIYNSVSNVELNKNPDETNGKNPIHIKAKIDSVSDKELQEIIAGVISRKDYHIADLGNGNYKLKLANKKYDLTVEFKASSDLVSKINHIEGKNFKRNIENNTAKELFNDVVYKYIGNNNLTTFNYQGN